MRRYFTVFLILMCFCFTCICVVNAQQINKDEIYKNSFRPDMPRSMQQIPYEDEEYLGKHYSPYALVIIPEKVKYEKDELSPGFYLVKPFSENSVDYLIFIKKQQAMAVVPVIDKEEIPKKIKKAQVSLIQEGHGEYYYVTVKFLLNSYTVRLQAVH